MKKKGLIIATIVMVLVLAVSLTTATYAWFTASSVTSLETFNVSVSSNNAVNIGVKTDCTFKQYGLTTDDFKTGAVTYADSTVGKLSGGWSGESNGLSANIDHNIQWGAQKTSVGVVSAANSTSTTINDYGTITAKYNSGTYTINSASLGENVLTDVNAAYANRGAETSANSGEYNNGDYVYLFLGASPTKALSENNLCIMLDMTSSQASTIGIMSSLHIAYRKCIAANKATSAENQKEITAWTEIDLFGTTHYGAQKTTLSSNAWAGNETTLGTASAAVQSAYGVTYGNGSTPATYPTASVVAVIDGLSTTLGDIDQIELVIYLAGPDGDCNNSGLGSSGDLKIFFQTVDA